MDDYQGWAILIPILLPLAGLGIGALAVWTDYKARRGALDVMRAYVEKGSDPPPEVMTALTASIWGNRRAERPSTRGDAVARGVFFIVLAAGLGLFSLYFLRGDQREVFIFTTALGIGAFAVLGIGLMHVVRGLMMPKTDGR